MNHPPAGGPTSTSTTSSTTSSSTSKNPKAFSLSPPTYPWPTIVYLTIVAPARVVVSCCCAASLPDPSPAPRPTQHRTRRTRTPPQHTAGRQKRTQQRVITEHLVLFAIYHYIYLLLRLIPDCPKREDTLHLGTRVCAVPCSWMVPLVWRARKITIFCGVGDAGQPWAPDICTLASLARRDGLYARRTPRHFDRSRASGQLRKWARGLTQRSGRDRRAF